MDSPAFKTSGVNTNMEVDYVIVYRFATTGDTP